MSPAGKGGQGCTYTGSERDCGGRLNGFKKSVQNQAEWQLCVLKKCKMITGRRQAKFPTPTGSNPDKGEPRTLQSLASSVSGVNACIYRDVSEQQPSSLLRQLGLLTTTRASGAWQPLVQLISRKLSRGPCREFCTIYFVFYDVDFLALWYVSGPSVHGWQHVKHGARSLVASNVICVWWKLLSQLMAFRRHAPGPRCATSYARLSALKSSGLRSVQKRLETRNEWRIFGPGWPTEFYCTWHIPLLFTIGWKMSEMAIYRKGTKIIIKHKKRKEEINSLSHWDDKASRQQTRIDIYRSGIYISQPS